MNQVFRNKIVEVLLAKGDEKNQALVFNRFDPPFDKCVSSTLSVAPDCDDAYRSFRVSHPFHPLRGREFDLVTYQQFPANRKHAQSSGKMPANAKFPDSRSDLFAMFVDRNIELSLPNCFVAMITMQSWMFLSTLEDLRATILTKVFIQTMAHLGAGAFDTIGGD